MLKEPPYCSREALAKLSAASLTAVHKFLNGEQL